LFLPFRGRLINNCSFVFVTKDPKATILEILRREGPVPVYMLAKALGLSYGAIQWYIFSLERGLVHGVKPDMTLREAIEVLEKKAPHIAELLRKLVEKT